MMSYKILWKCMNSISILFSAFSLCFNRIMSMHLLLKTLCGDKIWRKKYPVSEIFDGRHIAIALGVF